MIWNSNEGSEGTYPKSIIKQKQDLELEYNANTLSSESVTQTVTFIIVK